MFAMKLTLTVLGALLYLVGTLGWFFWAGPDLVGTGNKALLYAFAGTCAWLLTSFGLAIQIIKTPRPAGSLDKPQA